MKVPPIQRMTHYMSMVGSNQFLRRNERFGLQPKSYFGFGIIGPDMTPVVDLQRPQIAIEKTVSAPAKLSNLIAEKGPEPPKAEKIAGDVVNMS